MVVSFIGMATQEVAIKQTVNITLKSDAEVLEEVVVTGYGNFKNHHLQDQPLMYQQRNYKISLQLVFRIV